jgi:hypothetical protein
MAAVVEAKQKRAPYKTKRWYTQFDAEMTAKFPIGSIVRIKRGPKGYVKVRIVSRCQHGKIDVSNVLTGAQYRANVECMIPPDAKSPAAMAESLAPERAARAQEHDSGRCRPSVLRQFLQPIETADNRDPEYRERAKKLALSTDELTAYTSLSAINKTLSILHLNRDCFRNPKLFDLLKAAHACLATCMTEMESYTELPEDA